MQEKEINNAKKELANLYLILKSGNLKEVNNKSNYYLIQIENSSRTKRKRNK